MLFATSVDTYHLLRHQEKSGLQDACRAAVPDPVADVVTGIFEGRHVLQGLTVFPLFSIDFFGV